MSDSVSMDVDASIQSTTNSADSNEPVIEPEINVNGSVDVYVSDENVLAYHGPQLYPAKVLKAEQRDSGMQYFVHYNGWNKKWDEWVETSRLLKYTDKNVRYQHTLQQQKENAGKSSKQSLTNKSNKKQSDKPHTNNKRKSLAVDDDDTVHDDTQQHNEVKIKIPANLKKQLIVDWENVTRKQCIVPIPHTIKTVTEILDEFAASKLGKGDGM